MSTDSTPETERTNRAAPRIDAQPGDSAGPTGFTQQSMGGVFDGAFDLYKQNFSTLALIVACVFIPTQVFLHAAANIWLKPIAAHVNGANPDPVEVIQISVLAFFLGGPEYGVPGYISLLTSFMASGPIAVAVANILVGRPINLVTAYRRALPVFWRLYWMWNLLFVLFLLIFILVFAGLFITLVGIVAAITGSGINPNLIGAQEMSVAFIILMFVIPYITSCAVATVLFSLAPPLIGLEQLTGMQAIERNTRLVNRKVFWRVCLSVTLLPLLIFSLQFIILQSASSVVTALKGPPWSEFVVNTGLSSLISFFFQPYWMIFITLLYFDIRVRQEGLDVRYMADNLVELDPLLDPNTASPQPALSTAGQPAIDSSTTRPPTPTAAIP